MTSWRWRRPMSMSSRHSSVYSDRRTATASVRHHAARRRHFRFRSSDSGSAWAVRTRRVCGRRVVDNDATRHDVLGADWSTLRHVTYDRPHCDVLTITNKQTNKLTFIVTSSSLSEYYEIKEPTGYGLENLENISEPLCHNLSKLPLGLWRLLYRVA